ncbi:MAG: hypothetical protein DDT34_02165 [Firmicutes bacterium]|nr:hypothetical protein [Bacillota bacterium]
MQVVLPGIVVHLLKGPRVERQVFAGGMRDAYARLALQPIGRLLETLRDAQAHGQVHAHLVVILPQPVILQQRGVERVVVVHAERRVREAFHQQAGIAVVFAEVGRAIHARHAAFQQPIPGGIQQQVGGSGVVHTFEEPEVAHGPLVAGGFVALKEGRNAPHRLVVKGAEQRPALRLAIAKGGVLARVEHFVQVHVQRGHPMRVIGVQGMRHLAPDLGLRRRGDGFQTVVSSGHSLQR